MAEPMDSRIQITLAMPTQNWTLSTLPLTIRSTRQSSCVTAYMPCISVSAFMFVAASSRFPGTVWKVDAKLLLLSCPLFGSLGCHRNSPLHKNIHYRFICAYPVLLTKSCSLGFRWTLLLASSRQYHPCHKKYHYRSFHYHCCRRLEGSSLPHTSVLV